MIYGALFLSFDGYSLTHSPPGEQKSGGRMDGASREFNGFMGYEVGGGEIYSFFFYTFRSSARLVGWLLAFIVSFFSMFPISVDIDSFQGFFSEQRGRDFRFSLDISCSRLPGNSCKFSLYKEVITMACAQ